MSAGDMIHNVLNGLALSTGGTVKSNPPVVPQKVRKSLNYRSKP